jgi:hypothetical protein
VHEDAKLLVVFSSQSHDLPALVRAIRRPVGAAGFEAATSRVSDNAALARPILLRHASSGHETPDDPNALVTTLAPSAAAKCLLIACFMMVAAGFEPASSRV